MRKPIMAANWKMNKATSEAVEFANGLKELTKSSFSAEMVICPPFTALAPMAGILNGTNIKLGAQNMYWEKNGAFTGEISPVMLRDLGCKYVIVGHSERREYFKETNQDVNKKARSAFAFNLIPIVCVGEKLSEREAGKALKVVEKQVRESLADLPKEEISNIVVAYEPIWAIGTGKTATPGDAQEVHGSIRATLKDLYGEEASSRIRIQYGGSVKPDNISILMQEEDIDGALIGGASLNLNSFLSIVNFKK